MNITSINGRVFIDGQEYVKAQAGSNKIKILINGVSVGEYTDDIIISLEGNLHSIQTHDVTVIGNVTGDVNAHNLRCGNVGGNANAHNVTCGDIKGMVTAHNVMRK